MFTDRIRLRLIAGKGGNGVIAWRREKYIPKGGPSGGNGGCGGAIILQADSRERSLERYRDRRIVRAENGISGGSSLCNGRNGKDLLITVPCGTLVKDSETGEVLADLTEADQRWAICQGGRGGRGNASFKSPTRRAPVICTPGRDGQERYVELELKLIADVGLVGFPNAGKSTLIHAVTDMPVKIAPYPFTTLQPNVGAITFDDYQQLLLADIPGIIAGAADNRGLGLEFLRHIERTSLLLYMLDASGIDGRTPLEDFGVLRCELQAYDPTLLARPFCVALNKCDIEESQPHIKEFQQAGLVAPDRLFLISAQERAGLQELIATVRAAVMAGRADRSSQLAAQS